MPIQALFPTLVYVAPLESAGSRLLNARLLKESLQLQVDDLSGRRWSQRNYPGGFTSYGSANRMHRMSPNFAALEKKLARHVRAFCAALEFDLQGRHLAMTDCWVNIMSNRVAHGLHLHPLSTLSGTYYLKVPAASPGLKLEDPRLERYMAAPPRRAGARRNRPWVTVPARVGQLVLFESWLRHEVAANTSQATRVSISFNYNWF